MKAPKKNLLATSLLALPALASALGLGGIDVKSGLNQPLEAEIPITVASTAERESLQVGLARTEDWSRVGIDQSRLAVPLEFVVAKNARGETIIRVTSKEIVRDPFLQLLIEVNWNKGRLLREYSLLLDPPTMAPALQGSSSVASGVQEPVPAARTQPLAGSTVSETRPAPAAERITPAPPPKATPTPTSTPRPAEASATPAEATPAPSTAGGSYGPIKAGDTLWVIANNNRPNAGANMEQLMVSILRMNPQAFYQNNINALKKGAILRLPSAEEANQVSVAEAAEAIQSQNALWRSYQNTSAQNATLVADPGQSPAVREPSSSAVESEPRLALVPPKSGTDTGVDNGASAKALTEARAEIARLKEDLASESNEVGDSNKRVAELEKLKVDLERMLALKSDELATLQQELKAARELAARAPEPVVAPPVAATPDPVAEVAPEPEATTPDPVAATSDPTATPPDTTASTTELGASPTEITKEDIWGDTEPTDGTTTAPTDGTEVPDDGTTPADGTATLDENGDPVSPPMTADPNAVAGDGTTVTPIEESPTVEPETVPAEPATDTETPVAASEEPASTETPWYKNPLTWGAGLLALLGLGFLATRKKKPAPLPGPVATNAEDMNFGIPVAAPVSQDAYEPVHSGFDDDESRIRAAIVSNPQDLWSHLDLLRLYYGRQDAQSFESAASAMYGYVTDPESPQWHEARTMGEQIVPHSSLFAPMPDFGTMEMAREPSPVSPPPAFVDEPLGSLDLGSFDEPTQIITPVRAAPVLSKPAAAEPPADFSFDLDLDQPTRKLEPIEIPAPAPTPVVSTAKSDDFNFDFSFDAPSSPVEIKPAVVERPELAFDAPVDFSKYDVAPTFPPAQAGAGEIAFDDVVPAPARDSYGEVNLNDLSSDDLMIGDDSISTKLDLARAYLDMGDPDGARSMLEEVISEGSDVQRSEAQELLGRIA